MKRLPQRPYRVHFLRRKNKVSHKSKGLPLRPQRVRIKKRDFPKVQKEWMKGQRVQRVSEGQISRERHRTFPKPTACELMGKKKKVNDLAFLWLSRPGSWAVFSVLHVTSCVAHKSWTVCAVWVIILESLWLWWLNLCSVHGSRLLNHSSLASRHWCVVGLVNTAVYIINQITGRLLILIWSRN